MHLPKAHDDNLVRYVTSDTTLILTNYTFSLKSKNALVLTPRLIIHADTIRIEETLNLESKTLELHCNRLWYAPDVSINLKGADGQNIPAQEASSDINGKPGGSLFLHIHNAHLQGNDDGFTLWPQPLPLVIQGGAAGSYAGGSGTAGSDGRVAVYYSNPLLRSFAAMHDGYRSSAT